MVKCTTFQLKDEMSKEHSFIGGGEANAPTMYYPITLMEE